MTGSTAQQSRIADLLRRETGHELELFVRRLSPLLPGTCPDRLAAALRQTALSFHDGEQVAELLIERLLSGEEIGPEAVEDPSLEREIVWPQLYRTPHGYHLGADSLRGGPDDAGAAVDWMQPGVDDVVAILTMFQTELEAQRYVQGWNASRSADDPERLACRHGAASRICASGAAVVAWMPDPRNLTVWRDARSYQANRLIAVCGPGGALLPADALPRDLRETVLDL